MKLSKIQKRILQYEQKYNGRFDAPKYLKFMEQMTISGWTCDLIEAKSTESKYITVKKDDQSYRIRFSAHKAAKMRTDDIDFLCGGRSVNGVVALNSDELIKKLNT